MLGFGSRGELVLSWCLVAGGENQRTLHSSVKFHLREGGGVNGGPSDHVGGRIRCVILQERSSDRGIIPKEETIRIYEDVHDG